MIEKIDPRFRLAYLLSLQKVETTIILIIASFCLSLGFFFGDAYNINYWLMYDFANRYVWGALFAVYGVIKLLALQGYVDHKVRIINGCIGLWAWNYIFLSFAVFDTTPVAPTEWLLLVPVIAEVWILMSAVHLRGR